MANAKELVKQGMSGSKEAKKETIYSMIEKQTEGFKLVLPSDFSADRFSRIAITAIKSNPKLAACEPLSILGSLMLSAQLGLEPNSPLHEASLIPYAGKATFQIEYRGLLKLVWNSGLVTMIDYDKICENDEWEYTKGFNPVFWHRPAFNKDRGETIAYYAYAELNGGAGKALVIKSKKEVIEHGKKFSKSFGSGPWVTDLDSMGIKTALKELADKKLPKRTTTEAVRFARAIDMDDKIINAPAGPSTTINIDDFEVEDTLDKSMEIKPEPAVEPKPETKTEKKEEAKTTVPKVEMCNPSEVRLLEAKAGLMGRKLEDAMDTVGITDKQAIPKAYFDKLLAIVTE